MEALDQILNAEREAQTIREQARKDAKRILDDAAKSGARLIAEAEAEAEREMRKMRQAFDQELKDAHRDALGAGELKSLALQQGAEEREQKAVAALLEELTAVD